jgi:glycosyltransferase involved in cell wall biosynthesis
MTVTFVVPTRNARRTISACLRSLRHQDHDDVEIVVVDNHSTDGTPDLASAWADVVVTAGPERSAQRNHGARIGTGELVVFVDADMVLEPGVAREAAQLVGCGAFDALVLPELAFGDSFFARCRSLEKRLYLGDDSVEAARVLSRSLFERVGGWDESLTAGEDWDLTDRCRNAGARIGRTTARVWHDEGVVHLRQQFHKKRYYGVWVANYVARAGAQNRKPLARTSLVRSPRLLMAEPLNAAGLAVLKFVEGAGLAAGMARARRRGAEAV